ncbi:hypothetical protein ACC732_36660, partial [Rhizobium ruizarguesonis]
EIELTAEDLRSIESNPRQYQCRIEHCLTDGIDRKYQGGRLSLSRASAGKGQPLKATDGP